MSSNIQPFLIIGISGCISINLLMVILRKQRKRRAREEYQSRLTGEYPVDIPEVEGIMKGFEGWRPPEDVQQLPEEQVSPALPLGTGRYVHKGRNEEFPTMEKRYTTDEVLVLSIPTEETFQELERRKGL